MSSALLIVGSPKPRNSASRTLGEALLSRLVEHGWDTATARVPLRDPDGTAAAALLEKVAAADLVLLAFPLYIDTLPAPVTRFLEHWEAGVPKGRFTGGMPRLVVLTQSGFPEAEHTNVAVAVCRRFAREAGVPWAGSIAFGMGGALEGAGLDRGPFARFLPMLELAAEELTAGRPVPAEVGAAFASGAMPKAFYLTAAQAGWYWMAFKNKADAPIRERRYAQR